MPSLTRAGSLAEKLFVVLKHLRRIRDSAVRLRQATFGGRRDAENGAEGSTLLCWGGHVGGARS